MEQKELFYQRVLKRVPDRVTAYHFQHWSIPGRPTSEGFGILPVPGIAPEELLARVMDVDHYVGNLGHVVECRAVPDPAHKMPEQVRFYQRIKIPLLGAVHHELVLVRAGEIQGYHVAYWTMLERETEALGAKEAIRSQYNEGAWIVAPGIVGYALSSAPRRDDVGFIKWKAMTAGADVAASAVVRDNIEGMSAWAARVRSR